MRHKTQYKDKRATKKENVLVLLVEGETEENYLKYLKYIYNTNIKLRIRRKSTLGADINESILRFSKEESIASEELVLMYDLENSLWEYQKFLVNGQLRHKNTYLVQPCIEYHFLLHHKNAHAHPNRGISAQAMEKELKHYLPEYRKGSSFNWEKHAIGMAEVTRAKDKAIHTFENYEQAAFSRIGQLIKDYFIK